MRTRPRLQRALIRSWEYIQPVRVTFLVIRLLVVLWLIVLSAILLSAAIAWGWTPPAQPSARPFASLATVAGQLTPGVVPVRIA